MLTETQKIIAEMKAIGVDTSSLEASINSNKSLDEYFSNRVIANSTFAEQLTRVTEFEEELKETAKAVLAEKANLASAKTNLNIDEMKAAQKRIEGLTTILVNAGLDNNDIEQFLADVDKGGENNNSRQNNQNNQNNQQRQNQQQASNLNNNNNQNSNNNQSNNNEGNDNSNQNNNMNQEDVNKLVAAQAVLNAKVMAAQNTHIRLFGTPIADTESFVKQALINLQAGKTVEATAEETFKFSVKEAENNTKSLEDRDKGKYDEGYAKALEEHHIPETQRKTSNFGESFRSPLFKNNTDRFANAERVAVATNNDNQQQSNQNNNNSSNQNSNQNNNNQQSPEYLTMSRDDMRSRRVAHGVDRLGKVTEKYGDLFG